MREEIKAVVFDMDGVLFDTETLWIKSWERFESEKSIPKAADVFRRCIGTTRERTREIFFEEYGRNFPYDSLRAEADVLFRSYIAENGMPLMPYVRETLISLRNAGYELALATSTYTEKVLSELTDTGLIGYFTSVTCGDTVLHSKPEPDIYIAACEKTGRKPSECCAVEDSPNGILSAFRAGLRPIMVPDKIAPTEDILRLCAAVFPSLKELCGYLVEQ